MFTPLAKGGRTPFSQNDDILLIKYLAKYHPGAQGRTGPRIYKLLVENAHNKWSWGVRHTWASWQSRYSKKKSEFDRRIMKYQKEKGLPMENSIYANGTEKLKGSDTEEQEELKQKRKRSPDADARKRARVAETHKEEEEDDNDDELAEYVSCHCLYRSLTPFQNPRSPARTHVPDLYPDFAALDACADTHPKLNLAWLKPAPRRPEPDFFESSVPPTPTTATTTDAASCLPTSVISTISAEPEPEPKPKSCPLAKLVEGAFSTVFAGVWPRGTKGADTDSDDEPPAKAWLPKRTRKVVKDREPERQVSVGTGKEKAASLPHLRPLWRAALHSRKDWIAFDARVKEKKAGEEQDSEEEPKRKRKQSSRRHAPFTEKDDIFLTRYLAKYNPEVKGRRGHCIYTCLVDNEHDKWSWSAHHTWASWQNRYSKNKIEFDWRIENYQKKGLPMANSAYVLTGSDAEWEEQEQEQEQEQEEEEEEGAQEPKRKRKQSPSGNIRKRTKEAERHEEEEKEDEDEYGPDLLPPDDENEATPAPGRTHVLDRYPDLAALNAPTCADTHPTQNLARNPAPTAKAKAKPKTHRSTPDAKPFPEPGSKPKLRPRSRPRPKIVEGAFGTVDTNDEPPQKGKAWFPKRTPRKVEKNQVARDGQVSSVGTGKQKDAGLPPPAPVAVRRPLQQVNAVASSSRVQLPPLRRLQSPPTSPRDSYIQSPFQRLSTASQCSLAPAPLQLAQAPSRSLSHLETLNSREQSPLDWGSDVGTPAPTEASASANRSEELTPLPACSQRSLYMASSGDGSSLTRDAASRGVAALPSFAFAESWAGGERRSMPRGSTTQAPDAMPPVLRHISAPVPKHPDADADADADADVNTNGRRDGVPAALVPHLNRLDMPADDRALVEHLGLQHRFPRQHSLLVAPRSPVAASLTTFASPMHPPGAQLDISADDRALVEHLGLQHAFALMAANHGFDTGVVRRVYTAAGSFGRTDAVLLHMRESAENAAAAKLREFGADEDADDATTPVGRRGPARRCASSIPISSQSKKRRGHEPE
ncbi:hypothetical protein B0H17DRAFT_1211755 [Mycena rosella]|uniref:TERF2-interacting telomeric protein 1 Myb domain-containing protein n=1 Tax=Mycena rosella TaxID=1033263 RepID=A0AAD7CU61_MYCRO|nr:hypothetical protein B0H17DRAFT_1211755 [Mycena rosella]